MDIDKASENITEFKHDFSESKKESVKLKKQLTTRFQAVLKGQRLLSEGGLTVTLDIPETNKDSVKQMLDMTGMILNVFIVAEEPETFGGINEN